ncbi:MAG: sortase [Clostridia bacterium]
MNKLNIYKALRVVLVIIAIVVAILVARKFYKESKTENLAKEVLETIKTTTENSETGEVVKTIDAEMGGYKVVGIIRIPKIELEYPILEKTNVESLNISITKFWGNEINEIGNVTLAGHNNLSGVMFGKIKKLVNGDIIELTDTQNITLQYEVFETKIIDPNDISCILPIEEGRREITLITCENGRANRFIVKAKEVK